jgi:hypothetical protein
MRNTARLLAAAGVVLTVVALAWGCSLTSVSGGEGAKNIDVSMGGHITTDSRLNFKALGYVANQLTIQNTATATPLDIGPGTAITTGDGTVVASVVGTAISIAPQKLGILVLNAGLAPGTTYYLGATSSGKPSIRQLFICPGGAGPAHLNPAIPTQNPDPTESLLNQ